MSDRIVPRTRGFFVEAREHDDIHPEHYSISAIDGNGTKLFLSAWSGNYGDAPQDTINNNANDIATLIHAMVSEVMIYQACQTKVEENKMGEIMGGFGGATERIRTHGARTNLGKMETASHDEMVSLGIPGMGLDLAAAMVGYIKKTLLPNLDPQPGHFIVGVPSTGLHSNGYTKARHVLLAKDARLEPRDEWRKEYKGQFKLNSKPSILQGETILEALSKPTALYFREAANIGVDFFDNRDIYGINITGNGLHNLNRAGKNVSFHITDPLDPLPIHTLVVQESGMTPEEAYRGLNMGMGFGYIVPILKDAEGIVNLLNRLGRKGTKIIGDVRKGDSEELTTIIHKPYEGEELTFKGYPGSSKH